MTNNYAQQSLSVSIFFLCKKSFTEVQQVNPVINARLYIFVPTCFLLVLALQ